MAATVLQSLQEITDSDILLILREFAAMPQPEYSDACLRARNAASFLRKPTWSIFSMSHINALLLGASKIKYSDSYGIMRLMTAVECYAYGIMGQNGLVFEDFNLAIGPIASTFNPELFVEEQLWNQDLIPKIEYIRPSYRTRKVKAKQDPAEVDIIGLVDSLVKEVTQQTRPAPVAVHTEQGDQADTFADMLDILAKS